MPPRYTIKTATEALKSKKVDHFLQIKEIDHITHTVLIEDKDYGEYKIDIKSLSPLSNIPSHKHRKHNLKFEEQRTKYVNTEINGFKIIDVFYGPDRGYKNRSFYMEYVDKCGHTSIASKAHLLKHKKNIECLICSYNSKTIHGVRTKVNDVLKKRTPIYNYWVKIRATLPEEYKENFLRFKQIAGNKPFPRAEIVIINNKPIWVNLQIDNDHDINLIATAVRQAFRHSTIYKSAVDATAIETLEGTRHRCDKCQLLFKRNEMQVDHIDPIVPIDGTKLTKDKIIDRVWTEKIQVLDKKCHTQKSSSEATKRKLLRQKHKEEDKLRIARNYVDK